MSGDSTPSAPWLLSPYEQYYREAGLTEYDEVFRHNSEVDLEVSIYGDRLAGWEGWRAPSLRVLDIGCGLGTFTIKLLEQLLPSRSSDGTACDEPAVVFDLNDINESAFASMAEKLREVPRLKSSIAECVHLPWQELHPDQLAGPYDLIIANHTLYGVEIAPRVVESMLSRLAPGGRALISLCSMHSDIYKMRQRAGVPINTGEDLERALLEVRCGLTRLAYECPFYFDFEHDMFRNWLFATSRASRKQQDSMLHEFRKTDGERDYLVNRALIHILEQ